MASKVKRRSHVTWLMPTVTCLQFFLPRWLVLPLARLGGRLSYRFSHKQRERVLKNLRHILGAEASERELERTARRTFERLVVGYADMLRAPVLKRRAATFGVLDLTNLDRALASGKGAILVTGHIGNWDLAGVFLSALGYPLSAVVEPIPAGWTKTFNRYRCLTEMEAIPIPERRAIASAIQRRRILTLVADRDLTGNGIVCPAFDAKRAFPKGPAAYALKYKLPVVIGYFVFADQKGKPPYYAQIDPAIDFKPSGNMTKDISDFTHIIADSLNEVIGRYPDQWLAFRADWQ